MTHDLRNSHSPHNVPDAPARRTPSWTTAWPLALAALPLGLLAVAAWFGRQVRPSADEWCFLPAVRDDGISGLVGRFYFHDNGRLGNGLLVGLYAKYGVAGHQWYAPVSGVLVLGALWAMTALLLRATGRTAPRGVPLLVAAMLTAVFLFATTNTYKTFYWPASSVSHTLAPVLACAAGLPLLRARSRRGILAASAIALVVGTFVGTLSEETSVVWLVVLSAVFLLAGQVFTQPARTHVRRWCLTSAAGIVVGTLLLVTSPGSRHRRAQSGAGTDSIVSPANLTGGLRAFAHIAETVLTDRQYAAAAAAGLLLGLLTRSGVGSEAGSEAGAGSRARVLRPVRPLPLISVGVLVCVVSGYLCTVMTYSITGVQVLATERTWNDYLLLYVLLLAGTGALAGRALRTRLRFRYAALAAPVAAVAAAVCAVVCVSLAVPLVHLGHDMRIRAERWGSQDRLLREGAAHGARVLPYRPVSVGQMLEPFSAGGRRAWPAGCVADYYHLDGITYSPPGSGPAPWDR